MRYRLYMPEDFAALYAIEEACFEPPFRFGRRYMKRLVDAPDSVTWIAEDDGGMAGFAIVEWSRELHGINAYIETIEVAPAFRRCGVAGELMQWVEASARTAGATALWLHVAAENAAAIHLYEAHGFIHQGTEEHFYAPDRGAHIYRKSITREQTAHGRCSV